MLSQVLLRSSFLPDPRSGDLQRNPLTSPLCDQPVRHIDTSVHRQSVVVCAVGGYAARFAHHHLALNMQVIRHIVAIGSFLLLAACGRAPSGADALGAAGVLPQHFEITVDGTVHVLSPDDPAVSVVLATVSNAGTGLSLSALDKSRNLNFTILVNESHIRPGDFLVGKCRYPAECRTRSHTAILAPYPDGKVPDPLAGKMAYDDPELGLQPAVLTLTEIADVVWPGVGPAKRIRGSFRGELASIEHRGAGDQDRVVGPLKRVEGRFDMYAAVK